MEQVRKVTFKDGYSKEFYPDLKKRVAKYFADNKISSYGDWRLVLKTVILLTCYFGGYALLFTGWLNIWEMWGMAIFLGLTTAGIGFNVSHDAIHGSYSKNDTINYIVGLALNLIGGNRYLWSITHNIIHHTYTNVHEYDVDLEVAPKLLRLSENMEHNKTHRTQHIHGFVIYGLASLFWVTVKDWKKFFQKDIGPYKDKRHPAKEYFVLFFSKAIYYSYTMVIPLIFLPIAWWQFIIGFVTMHLVAGMTLGVVFQLAHVVDETDAPKADEPGSIIYNNWAVHQMETTANFAMDNKLINWYVGGLNFQVEHHLFPRISHVHYPALSKIVQQTAKEHGVPYNYNKTFADAIRSHYLALKKFSLPNPVSASEMKVA